MKIAADDQKKPHGYCVNEYTRRKWREYTVYAASLTEKASIIGRVESAFVLWYRSVACQKFYEYTCGSDENYLYGRYWADSIEYTCFDGQERIYTVSVPDKYRSQHFKAESSGKFYPVNLKLMEKTCQEKNLHSLLDDIEKIHGLYSPITLGLAAALACCGFTFLLGGGPVEMFCAFVGAGFGIFLTLQTDKASFYTFSLHCIVCVTCMSGICRFPENRRKCLWGISIQHEAGYICAMLFIIPGFQFITSGIDLASLICVPEWNV